MRLSDHAAELQRYKNYAPTGFDAKGLRADDLDRGEWIVVPVGRNRDSGPLAESNFAVALERLGGESDTIEVHRFGHWACGWFEIILAHPDRAEAVAEIACSLADYPVLSDDDFSRREQEALDQAWDAFGARDTARELGRDFGLQDATIEALERAPGLREHAICEEYTDNEGCHFNAPSVLERDTIARILIEARKEGRG